MTDSESRYRETGLERHRREQAERAALTGWAKVRATLVDWFQMAVILAVFGGLFVGCAVMMDRANDPPPRPASTTKAPTGFINPNTGEWEFFGEGDPSSGVPGHYYEPEPYDGEYCYGAKACN